MRVFISFDGAMKHIADDISLIDTTMCNRSITGHRMTEEVSPSKTYFKMFCDECLTTLLRFHQNDIDYLNGQIDSLQSLMEELRQ